MARWMVDGAKVDGKPGNLRSERDSSSRKSLKIALDISVCGIVGTYNKISCRKSTVSRVNKGLVLFVQRRVAWMVCIAGSGVKICGLYSPEWQKYVIATG